MVYSTIDYAVVGIVIAVGLALFYKALREPLGLLFGGIRNMFGWVFGRFSDKEEVYQSITYG